MDKADVVMNDFAQESDKNQKLVKKPLASSEKDWDEETDKKLLSLVKTYGSKRWKQIGRIMKRKTAHCIRRFSCYLKPGNIIRGAWTDQEDNHIKEWVKEKGEFYWTECALSLPGRTGKQCRDRWINQINPRIKKIPWGIQEDLKIFSLFREYGSTWTLIAQHFPHRSENQIKNRFYSTARKIAFRKAKIAKNEEFSTEIKSADINLKSPEMQEVIEELKKLTTKKAYKEYLRKYFGELTGQFEDENGDDSSLSEANENSSCDPLDRNQSRPDSRDLVTEDDRNLMKKLKAKASSGLQKTHLCMKVDSQKAAPKQVHARKPCPGDAKVKLEAHKGHRLSGLPVYNLRRKSQPNLEEEAQISKKLKVEHDPPTASGMKEEGAKSSPNKANNASPFLETHAETKNFNNTLKSIDPELEQKIELIKELLSDEKGRLLIDSLAALLPRGSNSEMKGGLEASSKQKPQQQASHFPNQSQNQNQQPQPQSQPQSQTPQSQTPQPLGLFPTNFMQQPSFMQQAPQNLLANYQLHRAGGFGFNGNSFHPFPYSAGGLFNHQQEQIQSSLKKPESSNKQCECQKKCNSPQECPGEASQNASVGKLKNASSNMFQIPNSGSGFFLDFVNQQQDYRNAFLAQSQELANLNRLRSMVDLKYPMQYQNYWSPQNLQNMNLMQQNLMQGRSMDLKTLQLLEDFKKREEIQRALGSKAPN